MSRLGDIIVVSSETSCVDATRVWVKFEDPRSFSARSCRTYVVSGIRFVKSNSYFGFIVPSSLKSRKFQQNELSWGLC